MSRKTPYFDVKELWENWATFILYSCRSFFLGHFFMGAKALLKYLWISLAPMSRIINDAHYT